MSSTLFIDFEWQSKLSLKSCGVYRTAEDPSTNVICAGWCHRDAEGRTGPVRVWKRSHSASIENNFIGHLEDPTVRVVAHGAEVEREVLRCKFGVDVPLSRLSCTMARASRLSLPRSLEGISAALGLDEQKDMDGHRAVMKLARPRRPSKENREEFWTEDTKPEDFIKAYEYCAQDVRTMMAVDSVLPELPPTERQIWEMTTEMNARGIQVDWDSLAQAITLAAEEETKLKAEFVALFGCSPNSNTDAARALGVPNLQKATIRDALKRQDLSPIIRRGLEIRQLYARASVKKLNAFAQRRNADGFVRGNLVYSGAERTQRWSGAGVQPQNFPRGMGDKTDTAFEALHAGTLPQKYPDVLKALSDMMKGFILGPLNVGDYSTIEPRVLAWLAGQQNMLELFRTGGDPYCDLATEIYGRIITKDDVKERFMGKQGVLSSGYQAGAEKFRTTLDLMHDVQIDLELAQRVINTYRRKYPRIVAFWRRMERAFVYAIREGKERIRASEEGAPLILMGTGNIKGRPFAYIELPSGRRLHYAYPTLQNTGGYRDQVHYLGRGWNTRWQMISTYGGKLTENTVQAVSRDIMADAMLRLRARGVPLRLTVHDEIVADALGYALADFHHEMNTFPEWARTLPLKAECFTTQRYRK